MEPFALDRGEPEKLPVMEHLAIRQVRDHAMFLIDKRGRIASWNEGVLAILGWSEADWLGQPAHVAFTPEDAAAGVPENEMRQAAETGRAGDDRWMQHKSGERFYALGAMSRIADEAGNLVGFYKVLRDATMLKEAQNERERLLESARTAKLEAERQQSELARVATALRERDEELRALTHNVRNYAIYTIDVGGRISSWHIGASLMKGYTSEQAIGMPFECLFTDEDRAAGRPQMEMEVAARSGEYEGDGQRVRRDGSRFDVAVVLTALRGQGGELLGYLKLTQDISQRKQQEREREEALGDAQAARAEAERANRSKTEFLATVSHELRTPLSAILGWTRVLEKTAPLDAHLRQGLSAISRNAQVQVQLIEDLLDMNRIELGQLRLALQPVELGSVVAAAIEAALPAASTKGVEIRPVFSIPSARVAGDPGRLQQIVGNLLDNAVKFTPPGGNVTVTLAPIDHAVEISVLDTGQGIEPAFLGRVFERFQQQESTTTRRHGGLGIGLAVVRELVRLHGGSERVESKGVGKGAKFSVTFPLLADNGVALRAALTAHDEAQRIEGVTVLLVDDEPDVRATAEQLLSDAGAIVLSASNATDALEQLQRHQPQVMLSDIGMPGHDGYELMRWVRGLADRNLRHTPAAAFTAYGSADDRLRALAAGFQLHLVKPVPPSQLVAAVAELARKRSG